MNKVATFLAAGVAAVFLGGAASAATVVSLGTCTVNDTDPYAAACWGVAETPPVNDSASLFNSGDMTGVTKWMSGSAGPTSGLFGYNDWAQLARAQDENSWSDNGLEVTFGDATSPYDGSWEWAGDMYEQMVIVLKQGNNFAAYLFEGGLPTTGEWDTTFANFGNNAGGLSHFSVYARGDISVVPLPAAGFLLFGGLAGLAAMRRRKA